MICLQLPEPNKAKDLIATKRDVDSLTVKWDVGVGEKSGFTVSLEGVNNTYYTISGIDQREWTFSGLTAGTEYTVVVATNSGDQTSESLTGKFYTSKYTHLSQYTHGVTLCPLCSIHHVPFAPTSQKLFRICFFFKVCISVTLYLKVLLLSAINIYI